VRKNCLTKISLPEGIILESHCWCSEVSEQQVLYFCVTRPSTRLSLASRMAFVESLSPIWVGRSADPDGFRNEEMCLWKGNPGAVHQILTSCCYQPLASRYCHVSKQMTLHITLVFGGDSARIPFPTLDFSVYTRKIKLIYETSTLKVILLSSRK
jgi:hypothetical protein